MAVTRKLDAFRGEARVTTWASKFVTLELSARLRRRVWRGRAVEPDETIWDRLADSTPSALQAIEHGELLAALRRAVKEDLTQRQRMVFQAAVIDEVPLDVLAERLQSTRGAIYKSLHDARRKLRDALTHAGYVEDLAS
jgi:RNA polymerase sigma-70 factor (ECF subfamily)